MNRRHWLFVLLVIAVAVGTIRLGSWQLDRLRQRRFRNAQVQANLTKPALDLGSPPAELAPASEYRTATAVGAFDYEHTFELVGRSFQDQPGVNLVTPFMIEGTQSAILVDRGWIPYQDRTPSGRIKYRVNGPVLLTGVLRLPDGSSPFSFLGSQAGEESGSYRSVSPERMGSHIPYPVLPYYLQLSEKVADSTPQPEPVAQIDLTEGPHLGYALQWFSFATISLLGGGYWLYRHLRLGAD